ncbi:UNVERIFIED_CONTAM: hypothetical protein K2H54_074411 [Gekko kuhli]
MRASELTASEWHSMLAGAEGLIGGSGTTRALVLQIELELQSQTEEVEGADGSQNRRSRLDRRSLNACGVDFTSKESWGSDRI